MYNYDRWLECGNFILIVVLLTSVCFCVGEITMLRGRVSELENAAPVYPEINISIPEDWIK